MKKLPTKLNKELKQFQLKNETLVRDVKVNPKDKIELEIGDIKQKDFKPQAKIKRWGNEVNFSIRRVEQPENIGDDVIYDKDKVIFQTAEEEVHFYEKPDIAEDGGLEIELLLKSKPKTNVFEFSIQTKGLNFFKQLPLTAEELVDCERPDNIVNSYAVYHKTAKYNKAGGQEYQTGKFCHIFRPHIIDADGNETWGDLNIDEKRGVLEVIVPKEFLEDATYPVMVDPTFGYQAAGSPNTTEPVVVLNTANATDFGIEDTPTLEFTGTDGQGDPLTYDIEISGSQSVVSGDSFVNTGSYSGSNLIWEAQPAVGQTFTGNGKVLDNVTFTLAKVGSPTADMTVKIWSITGTYGTTAIPNAVLATSNVVSSTTPPVWPSTSKTTFTFPLDQKILLEDGVHYAATIECAGTNGNYPIIKRRVGSLATHGGNFFWTSDNTLVSWSPLASSDAEFEVNVLDTDTYIYRESDTDLGFANTTVVADSDPFNSGDLMEYVVQEVDQLTTGTYTWRVRAKDLNAVVDNAWSATRTFNISVVSDSQTKSLQYQLFFKNSVTRSLEYSVFLGDSITRSLEYSVTSEASVTHSLEYSIYIAEYSREVAVSLPTTSAPLSTDYTVIEETTVSTSDNSRVAMQGSGFLLHQYTYTHGNNTASVKPTWEGQSTLAPSAAMVYMQLYNYTLASWVTYASNSTAAANTDFTLTALVNGSDFFDANNQVSVRIYQEAPVPNNIQGNTRAMLNLVSLWLSDNSGLTTDLVGPNNLTNTGGVSLASMNGQDAASFNGSNKLQISDAAQSGLDITGDQSWYFWINKDIDGEVAALAKWNHVSATSMHLAVRTTNTVGFITLTHARHTSGWAYRSVSTDTTAKHISNGTPAHVVMSYDASARTVTIWIDGVQRANGTVLDTDTPNSTAPFTIGARDNGNNMTGDMHQVMVYNRTSNQNDVDYIYNSGSGVAFSAPEVILSADFFGLEFKEPLSDTKPLAYNVITTPPAITRSLEYQITTENSVTRTLTYELNGEVAVQKSLQYTVDTIDSVTRSLEYSVITENLETRSLQYNIVLKGTIQKGLEYSILPANLESRSLQYNIVLKGTIQKGLEYTILSTDSVTRSLRYKLIVTQAITQQRSLKYTVITPASPVTRSQEYTIVQAVSETKGLDYYTVIPTNVTKGLIYALKQVPTFPRDLPRGQIVRIKPRGTV